MNKKIRVWGLSLIITFMLIVCGTINVNAVTITTDSSKTAGTGYYQVTNKDTLTIYKNNDNAIYDRTLFNAYKIVDVYYNSSQDALKYQFTENFQNFLNDSTYCPAKYRGMTIDTFISLDIGDAQRKDNSGSKQKMIVEGGYLTASDFASLMASYTTYIRRRNISGISLIDDAIATIGSVNTEVGTYLVIPSSADQVYGVMVNSIELKKESNTWEVYGADIIAKRDHNVDINLTYSKSKTGDFSNTLSTSYGAIIYAKVEALVPTYPASTNADKQLEIFLPGAQDYGETYTFPNNDLHLNSSYGINGTPILDSSNREVGTIESGSNGMKFIFPDVTLLTGLSKISIMYETSLTSESTVLGSSGNKFTATMTMSDPYITSGGTPGEAHQSSQATLTTYALQITGTPGAVFQILDSSGKSMGTITIGSAGTGELVGLAQGTYTVKQTKAPTGYALITDEKSVTVGTGDNTVPGKTGYYSLTFTNTVPAILPFTGSLGTILFTIFGSLLITASIAFLVIYKKRKQNQESATI